MARNGVRSKFVGMQIKLETHTHTHTHTPAEWLGSPSTHSVGGSQRPDAFNQNSNAAGLGQRAWAFWPSDHSSSRKICYSWPKAHGINT